MNKNTIIALVIGLVIGGVAIWLLLSFGVLGSTMIGGTGTAGTTSPTKMYMTDQGKKSFGDIKNMMNIQKTRTGQAIVVVPTDSGRCAWIGSGDTASCRTVWGGCSEEGDTGCNEWQDDDGGWRCTCVAPE